MELSFCSSRSPAPTTRDLTWNPVYHISNVIIIISIVTSRRSSVVGWPQKRRSHGARSIIVLVHRGDRRGLAAWKWNFNVQFHKPRQCSALADTLSLNRSPQPNEQRANEHKPWLEQSVHFMPTLAFCRLGESGAKTDAIL